MWRQNIKSLNGLKMQAMAQRADWHPHTHTLIKASSLRPHTHIHTRTHSQPTQQAALLQLNKLTRRLGSGGAEKYATENEYEAVQKSFTL